MASSPMFRRSATATRRRAILGVALLAVACLLATACGGHDPTAERGGTADPSGSATAEEAFPVTVEHKFGSTEIEEEPERVLSLGFTEHEFVLALGVTPVAARYPQLGPEDDVILPWAEEAAGGANPEVLNMTFGELNFERIAALEPDLILGVTSGITADEYETLSEIAPTVAQSDEYIDFGMPWQETTLMIGQALGREDRAEALVTGVEQQFRAVREAHPEFDGATVAAVYYGGGSEVSFFASDDGRARFFTDLGFDVPAELDEIAGDEFYGELSGERLDLIDTDVVVWNQLQFTDGGRTAIDDDPLVRQLDATRQGRVLYLDGDLDDALQLNSVLSLPFLLERIGPMLDAALDGDPATEPTPR